MVVAAEPGGALGGLVRQLSIDQFENEGRRVIYGTPENGSAARKLLDRQVSINSVPKKVTVTIPAAFLIVVLAFYGKETSKDLVFYIDLVLTEMQYTGLNLLWSMIR